MKILTENEIIITVKKKKMFSEIIKYKYIYLIMLPGLLYYIVYKYIPMLGTVIAFQDFYVGTGFLGSEWVGFKHFQRLFTSYYFPVIFKNTMIISGLHILFGFPAPIILALLLNEVKSKVFKRIAQTITYLPHFISWIIIAGLMTQLLSPTTGIAKYIFEFFGKEPVYFLGSPQYFRTILVISGIWSGVGWGAIIYLAALSGIDPELYDASIVDGANRWKQTLHITLPGIMPVIVIMLILRIGNIFDAGFDQIFNLYSPAVYKVADIFDTYTYREGLLNANYSFATAVGLFKGIVGLILVTGTNMFSKYVGQDGIW